jgi:hypothetical protein
MVTVWPLLGPEPEKVPVAVAPVALVVRLNVLGLLPAELVIVIVGAVIDVGTACTVPMADAAAALVVSFNVFEPSVIVTVWLAPGAPVKVPVALAAFGALAGKVWPSTVTVEVAVAPLLLTVPVTLAATPPIATFQSFLTASFVVPFEPGATEYGPPFGAPDMETSTPSTALTRPLRLICCIVKRVSLATLSQCS